MKSHPVIWLAIALSAACNLCRADSGYELWLNYRPQQDPALRAHYLDYASQVTIPENRYAEVIRQEWVRGLGFMLGRIPDFTDRPSGRGIELRLCAQEREALGEEGYRLHHTARALVVQAAGEAGLLYGTFHLLQLMQCGERLEGIDLTERPHHALRLLNHWDDLTGTIERGYAGASLWKWDELPEKLDPRYADYARANASIGINGIVLNNVNADPRILRADYLAKVAALADLLRDYHIRVYLAVNFAAPMPPSDTPDLYKRWGGIGHLDTADPLDEGVQAWWGDKVREIYGLIPDFGGFLVKANSERMPGPQDYGRTHAEGANMLARALKPYGGVVMWRTFVYNADADPDRVKRPYAEFMPLDGQFDDNVILQAKNGPLDFQAREPVQSLFGGLRHTAWMPELQITQEYIGQSTYLVYLLPMWREFFDFDTHRDGAGSTIRRLSTRAIAGVANTGSDRNWTGHHFAQANWYAFGHLAWNPGEDSRRITDSWIRTTWNCDEATLRVIRRMMEPSWESFVAATTPYALGITCSSQDHYTAGFSRRAGRMWQVSREGIGTDRSSSGSDYVSQYPSPNRELFDDPKQCPEKYLLWFHFLPWEHPMASGQRLQVEFFDGLHRGVAQAERNIRLWDSIEARIDRQRFEGVRAKLCREKVDAEAYYLEAAGFFGGYVD